MKKERDQGRGTNGQGFAVRRLSLDNPDDARKELVSIGVDPAGIARMLPKIEPFAILVADVPPHAANILKQEMLSIGGDAAVARGTVACSVKETDVLLIGSRKQLEKLCVKLTYQPFGLSGLSEYLLGLLDFRTSKPGFWRLSKTTLSLERPLIMGILNVTPDSFSDGGRFLEHSSAVDRALQMEQDGADLIDIGGESSRPGAPAVSPEEEIARILPVIEKLAGQLSIPISVDTWKSSVAKAALASGAEVVNDISGFTFDPEMPSTVASSEAGVVLMHTRGTPETMQNSTVYDNMMREIAAGLLASAERAEIAGISSDRIVLDPGIGFAKNASGNLEILRRLREFVSLGYPVMAGTSRKSFIGSTLGSRSTEDRLLGTAATVAIAVANGASILRVHDVKAMKDVSAMAHAITNPQ